MRAGQPFFGSPGPTLAAKILKPPKRLKNASFERSRSAQVPVSAACCPPLSLPSLFQLAHTRPVHPPQMLTSSHSGRLHERIIVTVHLRRADDNSKPSSHFGLTHPTELNQEHRQGAHLASLPLLSLPPL